MFLYDVVVERNWTHNPYYFMANTLVNIPVNLFGVSIPAIQRIMSSFKIDDKLKLIDVFTDNKYFLKYYAGYDFSKLFIPAVLIIGSPLVSIPKSSYGEYNFGIPRIVGQKHA
jgi:hypothetical protein